MATERLTFEHLKPGLLKGLQRHGITTFFHDPV
jgi:hypothetical protein